MEPALVFSLDPLDIEAGSFLAFDSDELALHWIQDEFPEELIRLQRAYSLRMDDSPSPSVPSPSQILFGKDYDEINRTLTSALALRWIHRKQYERFVGTQPDPIRLRTESFEWIHGVFARHINTTQDLAALITSIVVNDLGKDPELSADYLNLTGDDISDANHDMILYKAASLPAAGLVPSLQRLPASSRQDIIWGMKLGAEFNFGQLAQAENVPACLSGLLDVKSKEKNKAFCVRFMEQLLDVAGASGHMDWTCAKKLVEPVFQAYHNVYDASMGIIDASLSLRQGYDLILARREAMLHEKGLRHLDISNPDDRALLRILCMGGVADLSRAALYDDIWSSLNAAVKASLVRSLNLDGSVQEAAVQPTYMPALLAKGLGDAGTDAKQQSRRKRLQSMLRYLARVLALEEKLSRSAFVFERNVFKVVKEVVGNPQFQIDPDILDTTPVPTAVVVVAARGSASAVPNPLG